MEGREQDYPWHLAHCRDGKPERAICHAGNNIYGAIMSEKAVIDRFEGTFAVLLIGDDSRRLNVPKQLIPKRAKEGTWLQLEYDGNELVKITVDKEETEKARKRIAEKLERLRRGFHRGENK